MSRASRLVSSRRRTLKLPNAIMSNSKTAKPAISGSRLGSSCAWRDSSAFSSTQEALRKTTSPSGGWIGLGCVDIESLRRHEVLPNCQETEKCKLHRAWLTHPLPQVVGTN